jgi:transposase
MDDKHDVKAVATEASAPPTRALHAGGGGAAAGQATRMSAKKKLAAVQRLMRGESLGALSRELSVPAHRLSDRHDRALIAFESGL